MKYILLLIPLCCLCQKPITEYYDNGNVFRTYFVKNKTLDSTFVQYYKNGNMLAKILYKKCEYKTNYTHILRFFCDPIGRYFDEEKQILKGKRHGKWFLFYEDGTPESVSNYHCGIEQGNFISYRPDGTIKYSKFYHKGNLITERKYHQNGVLKVLTQYTYTYSEEKEKIVVSYTKTEFRRDSTIKSLKEVQNYEENDQKGTYKEFYPNGFLKITEELLDDFRHGIYREFYDNGNKKYEGRYIDEEPVEKHYYYTYSGEITKIEYWEANTLIRTEYIQQE